MIKFIVDHVDLIQVVVYVDLLHVKRYQETFFVLVNLLHVFRSHYLKMKFGFFIEKYFKEIYANCFCNCAIVRNASKPTLADFADVELAPSSSVVRPNLTSFC